MSRRNHRRSPSSSAHSFGQVAGANIQRSRFDRSHGLKTTFDAGDLIPIWWDEALPGDTISLRLTTFMRMATPLFATMDNIVATFFFFAVPNRLLWDKWQNFMGEETNPGDEVSPTLLVPRLVATAGQPGTLSDYFGIPMQTGSNPDVNALHLRAYNLCYSEWFRDENLQDKPALNTGDGPDLPTDYPIQKRGKRHDYFTGCLPFPQKGPDVSIGITGTVPVTGTGTPTFDGGGVTDAELWVDGAGTDHTFLTGNPTSDTAVVWNDTALEADLSDTSAVTINELREAITTQQLFERDARGGTRYTELLRSHFGITNHPDSRLQRPEYLGGGQHYISVTPVASTVGTSGAGDELPPQGHITAYATGGGSNIGFTKSFVEHCTLIGLVSVRADLNYQQGLQRMWTRQTRFDYYWPTLAHLGEQPVLNREIYYQGAASEEDFETFGYQERYSEYKYKPSSITGKMRSNDPQTLDAWHLAQDFDELPVLNGDFIVENPPIDRIIAVQDEPHFIFDGYFQQMHVRPMPTHSTPGLKRL